MNPIPYNSALYTQDELRRHLALQAAVLMAKKYGPQDGGGTDLLYVARSVETYLKTGA